MNTYYLRTSDYEWALFAESLEAAVRYVWRQCARSVVEIDAEEFHASPHITKSWTVKGDGSLADERSWNASSFRAAAYGTDPI